MWFVCTQLFFQCIFCLLQGAKDHHSHSSERIPLNLVFFSAFKNLWQLTSGIMESISLSQTELGSCSLVPTLHVGRIEDLGLVPLFLCFLDGNTTSTIPFKYAAQQKQAFKLGCAHSPGPASSHRLGSYADEINAWLWSCGTMAGPSHISVIFHYFIQLHISSEKATPVQ